MKENSTRLESVILHSEGILETISPWMLLIAEDGGYPHFNKIMKLLPSDDITIQKFIFFCLFPFFYKVETEEEKLFLKVLQEVNPQKLNLKKYVEECEILYLII